MRTWRFETEVQMLPLDVLEHRGVVNLVADFRRYKFEERFALLVGHGRFDFIGVDHDAVVDSLSLFQSMFLCRRRETPSVRDRFVAVIVHAHMVVAGDFYHIYSSTRVLRLLRVPTAS